jgi:hypothetical protein
MNYNIKSVDIDKLNEGRMMKINCLRLRSNQDFMKDIRIGD